MDDDKKKDDKDKKEDKVLVKMQARINELEAELKEKDEIILNYLNKKEDNKKDDKDNEDEKSEEELFKERQKKRLEYYKKHLN